MFFPKELDPKNLNSYSVVQLREMWDRADRTAGEMSDGLHKGEIALAIAQRTKSVTSASRQGNTNKDGKLIKVGYSSFSERHPGYRPDKSG